jgi:hypothetical protein
MYVPVPSTSNFNCLQNWVLGAGYTALVVGLVTRVMVLGRDAKKGGICFIIPI